ncbi:MAG: YceI family protein [Pseudonocardiaceae bacterium]
MATGEGGGVITGTVVTRDGWPVEHAIVTVVDATGTQSGRTVAGHDGHFAVAGLGPGSYTVITAAVGHDPQARTGQVNGAGPVDLGRLVLSRAGATALPRPGTWQIDPVHSTVAATAVHLGFAKVHGRFRRFAGTLTVADSLEHSSADVVIDAASIDTDNPDRDAHLRSPDFLDVQAYPQIRYTGHRLTVLRPDTWQLDGRLTLKSVTQPVTLDITYLGTAAGPADDIRAGFEASTQLDRDQFGMIWNQSLLAGVLAVGRTLRVTIDIEAVWSQ